VVTVSARLSRAVTTCDSNVSDLTFTGPESQARLACALAVRTAYSATAPSGHGPVAVEVLRPCDAQRLPERVATAPVELVAKRSSKADLLLATAKGERGCVDADSQTVEAHIDITPFDDLASCRAARDVLEERERKDFEAAKREGLASLDREVKHWEQVRDGSRSALAEFDAHKKEALSAADREAAANERNRLVGELDADERMLWVLQARRADEERRPLDPSTVFECVRTRSPP
jgi:hypothetical protein